jgi:hypothetical protein
MASTLQLRYLELMRKFSPENIARLPLNVQLYPAELEALVKASTETPIVPINISSLNSKVDGFIKRTTEEFELANKVDSLLVLRFRLIKPLGHRKELKNSKEELRLFKAESDRLYLELIEEIGFILSATELSELLETARLLYSQDSAMLTSVDPEQSLTLDSHIRDLLALLQENHKIVRNRVFAMSSALDSLYTLGEKLTEATLKE